MLTTRGPESRGERLVLATRAALAAAVSVALPRHLFDASASSAFIGVWSIYVLYAVALLLLAWNRSGATGTTKAVEQTIDTVAFVIIVYAASTSVAGLTLTLLFLSLAATIRFTGKAMLLAALVPVAFYALMSVVRGDDGPFRVFVLFALTALVVLSASHRQRLEEELARLTSWSRSAVMSEEALAADLLDRAASLLRVRRAIVALDDGGARRGYLGESGSSFSMRALEHSVVSALFDLSVGGRSMHVPDPSGKRPAVVHVNDERFEAAAVVPDADLVNALGASAMLIIPFEGPTTRGRVLFLDRRELSTEDVTLGELFAGIVSSRFEQFRAAVTLRSAAVAEERLRVGRDLHDWLLQSLTGAALQLQTLHKLMDRDPQLARSRLLEIQQLLSNDQSELRWFIDQLQPGIDARSGDALLTERLAAMAERFRRQWDLRIELEVAPVVQLVRDSLRHEIYSIVNEAVANAAKHAQATHVTVEVKMDDRAVHIVVEDNGRGFPFSGSYDLRTLVSLKRGPVTLKERVASLGGNLVIDSGAGGATVAISVPIAMEDAR